jgi:hypothetical protein
MKNFKENNLQTTLRPWEEITGKIVDVKIFDGCTEIIVKSERIMEMQIPLNSVTFKAEPSEEGDKRRVSILRTSSGYVVRLDEGLYDYLSKKYNHKLSENRGPIVQV